MRELKFRVWDKDRKLFSNHENTTGAENYDEFYGPRAEVLSSVINSLIKDEHIIQQYIGLTDVINKEIYEGDLVILTDFYINKSYGPFEVKWDNIGLCFNFGGYTMCSEVSLKVVGNIFEGKNNA